ncbi:MAG: hypothetical protein P8Z35_03100, partial [Ignavibacteriaceae bacterium]
FDKHGRLIVSYAYGGNANAGAMSSYNVSAGGISLITGPVNNQQTAPCWVAVTKNGKFAYTTNTGTSNISGYRIQYNGGWFYFRTAAVLLQPVRDQVLLIWLSAIIPGIYMH